MKKPLIALSVFLASLSAGAVDIVPASPVHLAPGRHVVDTLPRGTERFKIHARCRGREWTLFVGDLSATLSAPLPAVDDAHRPGRMLTLKEGASTHVREASSEGFNSLVAVLFRGRVSFYAGDEELRGPLVAQFDMPDTVTEWGIDSPHGVEYVRLMSDVDTAPRPVYSTAAAESAPDDRAAGVWRYFDRDTDPRRALPGGTYVLRVCPAGADGSRDIVYLDGADTNAGRWKPGRLKGRLLATPYENVYDLEWYDASGRRLSGECNALLDPAAGLLTLNFPMLKSSLRFTRTGR